MDASDEIEFTVSTFLRVLNVEKHRMAVGVALRNRIQEDISRGKTPDHYRVRWMSKGISRVVRELEKIGRDFNAENQADKFSTTDMIDVANSVVETLKGYLERED
jgi:hypothetical protein